MEWDRAVLESLERMTIYRRERTRDRLTKLVEAEGRSRVTTDDLQVVQARGGMAARRGDEAPLAQVEWPVLAGAYRVLDPEAPIAVCTLASEALAAELGHPDGVAIVGRAFTENLGAEKVVINCIASPSIRVLILCGTESRHHVGQTLQALHSDGLDEEGRVRGSRGPVPVMRNLDAPAQGLFARKITLVDCIGETDPAAVLRSVSEQLSTGFEPWSEIWRPGFDDLIAERLGLSSRAEDSGGFALLSVASGDRLTLEHYSNDGSLLRRVSARTAEALCRAAVQLGVVTNLSHAAYLGREAATAEIALQSGLRYEQDRRIELER